MFGLSGADQRSQHKVGGQSRKSAPGIASEARNALNGRLLGNGNGARSHALNRKVHEVMARKILNDTAQLFEFDFIDEQYHRPLNVWEARNRIKEIADQFARDTELSDVGSRLLSIAIELDRRRAIAEEVMHEAMAAHKISPFDDEH